MWKFDRTIDLLNHFPRRNARTSPRRTSRSRLGGDLPEIEVLMGAACAKIVESAEAEEIL